MELVERPQRAQAESLAVTSAEEAEALVIYCDSVCFSYVGESETEPGVHIFHWSESSYDPPMVLQSDSGLWLLKTEVAPNVFTAGYLVSTDYLQTNWVEPTPGSGA